MVNAFAVSLGFELGSDPLARINHHTLVLPIKLWIVCNIRNHVCVSVCLIFPRARVLLVKVWICPPPIVDGPNVWQARIAADGSQAFALSKASADFVRGCLRQG
jgi:hypothetical protein